MVLTKKVALSVLSACVLLMSDVTVRATGQIEMNTIRDVAVTYITPEQFGAKGDGITDDTEAFRECMDNSETTVYLENTYLIRDSLTAHNKKYFYAASEDGGTGAAIICDISGDKKALSFGGDVTFENVAFHSTLNTTGTSPHGETYGHTSNVVFVEVWNSRGTFTNCAFENALTAIRGRKSTDSTEIPKMITIDDCTFTECKSPMQGYCERTVVNNSRFFNDGDLYSGDHCIYMERYGCRSLKVNNCTVETRNSDSGAAFQIYGEPKSGDVVPEMTIDGCTIYANGIASSSAAHVVIRNCVFVEQKAGEFITWVESGSTILRDSTLNHTLAFSYAESEVTPYVQNCTFRQLTDLDTTRCNFPKVSNNCTFVDWGGNVRVDGTTFENCTFKSSGTNAADIVYISNESDYKVRIINTTFQEGGTITDNESAVVEKTNCRTFS